MITRSKQVWAVGATVRVGFVADLLVVASVATPGDGAPDAYVLLKGERFYSFVPHNDLSKISAAEAQKLAEQGRAVAMAQAAEATAKAAKTSAAAALARQLMAA